jgi:hypothetical protein
MDLLWRSNRRGPNVRGGSSDDRSDIDPSANAQ